MRNIVRLTVFALFTSLASTNILAGETPTVSDAHQLLGSLIGNGLVYATDGFDSNYAYFHYQGSNCESSFPWGENGDATIVDWSTITSVYQSDKEDSAKAKMNVHLIGGLVSSGKDGTKSTYYKSVGFYLLDEKSRSRVEKAMTLLMNACANKVNSKFD